MPEKAAVTMAATGQSVSYAELDRWTAQGAEALRSLGAEAGEVVLILLENSLEAIECALACIRSGLRFTPVGLHVHVKDAAYIARDCQARICIASQRALDVFGRDALQQFAPTLILVDGDEADVRSWRDLKASVRGDPLDPTPLMGAAMVYTSGTTGTPKGIRTPITDETSALWEAPRKHTWRDRRSLSHSASDVYLSTGPLSHIAPFYWCCLGLKHGASVVVMESFDPSWMLMLVGAHAVSHVQVVPTMLSRVLGLNEAEFAAAGSASLRHIELHSAPCPAGLKDRAIRRFGPVIYEIYGASEPGGSTFIDSLEWAAHRGSVGTPLAGRVHILNEDGQELPPGCLGLVYFSGAPVAFEYLNSQEKWRNQRIGSGMITFGDLGYLDDDGYLYLTGRLANMIIRGGFNVYPLEIEACLMDSPIVLDAHVLGVEDGDLGQKILAFVELKTGAGDAPHAVDRLAKHCGANLASYKCPDAIRIVDRLPRTDSGKIRKADLAELIH